MPDGAGEFWWGSGVLGHNGGFCWVGFGDAGDSSSGGADA